ncbi:hypothetical protein D3C87_227080 [compost metagenome]
MCTCQQKERLNNPRQGFFDYVFLCKKSDGKNRVITLTASNDSSAKSLAEKQCSEEEEENEES